MAFTEEFFQTAQSFFDSTGSLNTVYVYNSLLSALRKDLPYKCHVCDWEATLKEISSEIFSKEEWRDKTFRSIFKALHTGKPTSTCFDLARNHCPAKDVNRYLLACNKELLILACLDRVRTLKDDISIRTLINIFGEASLSLKGSLSLTPEELLRSLLRSLRFIWKQEDEQAERICLNYPPCFNLQRWL